MINYNSAFISQNIVFKTFTKRFRLLRPSSGHVMKTACSNECARSFKYCYKMNGRSVREVRWRAKLKCNVLVQWHKEKDAVQQWFQSSLIVRPSIASLLSAKRRQFMTERHIPDLDLGNVEPFRFTRFNHIGLPTGYIDCTDSHPMVANPSYTFTLIFTLLICYSDLCLLCFLSILSSPFSCLPLSPPTLL